MTATPLRHSAFLLKEIYASVFAVGAMFAAIGAVLVAPIRQAHYLMGLDPLLLSFIVVYHWRPWQRSRHRGGGYYHRHERWHYLGILFADIGKDDFHNAGRLCIDLSASRIVWDDVKMMRGCLRR